MNKRKSPLLVASLIALGGIDNLPFNIPKEPKEPKYPFNKEELKELATLSGKAKKLYLKELKEKY